MQTQNPENRARWKNLIQDQMTSGLTVSAFCINHNLKIQQFAYYKSVLFPKKKPSSSFIEVQSQKPAPKSASRILLNFKQISLSFDADHDPFDYLNKVFANLPKARTEKDFLELLPVRISN